MPVTRDCFTLDPCSCKRSSLGTGFQGKTFAVTLHYWMQPGSIWPQLKSCVRVCGRAGFICHMVVYCLERIYSFIFSCYCMFRVPFCFRCLKLISTLVLYVVKFYLLKTYLGQYIQKWLYVPSRNIILSEVNTTSILHNTKITPFEINACQIDSNRNFPWEERTNTRKWK